MHPDKTGGRNKMLFTTGTLEYASSNILLDWAKVFLRKGTIKFLKQSIVFEKKHKI